MSRDKDFSGSPWGSVPSNADMAVSRLEQARAFLTARSPDAAIREAQAALELSGGEWISYQALDVLADAYWMKDEPLTTLDIGERMLAVDSQGILGYIQVARAALATRIFPKAHFALEAGMREHPHSVSLIILMSIRHRLVGHIAGAEPLARQAVELAPNNVEALNNLAQVLMERGRRKEAKAIIQRIHEIEPAASSSFSVSAQEAFAQNRFADAIEMAKAALERDPENALCRQIIHRSRVYKSWAMWPFWQLYRMNAAVGSVVVMAALAGLMMAGRTLIGAALGFLLVYSIICLMIAMWVERRDPGASKKSDKVDLKDY